MGRIGGISGGSLGDVAIEVEGEDFRRPSVGAREVELVDAGRVVGSEASALRTPPHRNASVASSKAAESALFPCLYTSTVFGFVQVEELVWVWALRRPAYGSC
jgi:hypothetical protein